MKFGDLVRPREGSRSLFLKDVTDGVIVSLFAGGGMSRVYWRGFGLDTIVPTSDLELIPPERPAGSVEVVLAVAYGAAGKRVGVEKVDDYDSAKAAMHDAVAYAGGSNNLANAAIVTMWLPPVAEIPEVEGEVVTDAGSN